jgi:nucleoside-diphosphate-sugar epimerase
MKILITGAFGFVGTNLSAYLAERGHELWAVDVGNRQSAVGNGQLAIGNKQPAMGNKNAQRSTFNAQRTGGASVCLPENAERRSGNGAYARCFGWDELDVIPWGEVEAVVHLAGKAHDMRNTSDPQSYFDVNVGLTKRVLEAWGGGEETTKNTKSTEEDVIVAIRKDAKMQRKFILFSSVKAVADRVEGVLKEDAVPAPQTPYGQSKLEAEELVRSSLAIGNTQLAVGYAQSVIGNDSTHELMNSRTHELRYYILRPCMIHGPGNKGNLNLLYGVVRRGVPWPLGAFENRRSFASIGNVCAVVEGLLTGNVAAGVYQVADDDALSTNELIELMADTMGKRARIWRVSKSLMRVLARGGDVLHLPLNSERLQKLTESYVASNKKIKAALGWEWMPVDAREGMRRTIMSFETTKNT